MQKTTTAGVAVVAVVVELLVMVLDETSLGKKARKKSLRPKRCRVTVSAQSDLLLSFYYTIYHREVLLCVDRGSLRRVDLSR
jgi:hypothetical protein